MKSRQELILSATILMTTDSNNDNTRSCDVIEGHQLDIKCKNVFDFIEVITDEVRLISSSHIGEDKNWRIHISQAFYLSIYLSIYHNIQLYQS